MDSTPNALRNQAGYELVHAFLEATGLTIVDITPPYSTNLCFQLTTFPGVLRKFKVSSKQAAEGFVEAEADKKDKEGVLFRISLGVFEDIEAQDYFDIGFHFKHDRTVVLGVVYTPHKKLYRSNENFIEQVVGHYSGHVYSFEEAVERMSKIYIQLRKHPAYFRGYFYKFFPEPKKKKEYSEEY